ncbi:MAG: PEP-CTERM sorting domain-containing protein, partial [Oceanipulchritudo sp.]
DVVTAGVLGDAITNSTPGVANRTNIELGTAVDQSTGPVLVVPEPSTYAAILGALALGFILIRRRCRN